MFVLTAVMSLRYYHGHLGVVHYVILMKWREIAAISVAASWLGGEEWWWWWSPCCSHVLSAEAEMCTFVKAPSKYQVCCDNPDHFPHSNSLSHQLSYWAPEVQCSSDTLLYESHPFWFTGFSLTSSESLLCTKAATGCYQTYCVWYSRYFISFLNQALLSSHS